MAQTVAVMAAEEANRPIALTQRGRASVDALGALHKTVAASLRKAAQAKFETHPAASALAWSPGVDREATVAWVGRAKALAEADPTYRLDRFFQAYVAVAIYEVGIPAVEERRAQFELGRAATPPSEAGTLELDPDLAPPRYYEIEWHLRPGGWEGYDLYGPLGRLVASTVFRPGGFAAVPLGGNADNPRARALRQLPKARYERLYEPGCGPGPLLLAAHAVYPEAELVGSELSPVLLHEARATAASTGVPFHLRQRDAAADTGEASDSFDAVVTFALHHELPYEANLSLLREMFRILKPGGDIMLADAPPFRAVSAFHATILDWETENRGEPFFSQACASDWEVELRRIGFVDVVSRALGAESYPWVITATKPVEQP